MSGGLKKLIGKIETDYCNEAAFDRSVNAREAWYGREGKLLGDDDE